MKSRHIKILGTGQYLPKNKVTAAELANKLAIEEDWIVKKSGVLVRYFVEEETASQMGAYAAKEALAAADLPLEAIDCIVCTSAVAEQSIPCTAALIQKHLGAENSGIPAFDINSTCLSFLTGLDLLSYLIEGDRYQNVLLVATEVGTGINWQDKESATLFGDGAAAVIISKSPTGDPAKIVCSHMETYSKGAHLSECQGGGNKYRLEDYANNMHRLEDFLFKMNGKAIYKLAVEILPSFLDKMLRSHDLDLKDIDMVIPHQASLMALGLMRKQLGISTEKWMTIAHNYGNTVAASIPMTLHEAIVMSKVNRGDLVLLLGTAAGFSLGAVVLQY